MRTILAACTILACTSQSRASRPWMDASLPVPERVQRLMNEMTLEERCRQSWAVHNFHWDEAHEWANASVGSIKLSAFPNTTFEGVLEYRNTIAAVFVNGGRLGIPPSFHQETLLSAAPNATNIPLPVTLGSSWDVDIVARANGLVASELRAVGGDVGYSPEVNMYDDPRFGRLQEGFSSDPTLSAELGVAATLAFQADNGTGPGTYLPPLGAAALGKHFIAYGPASGGQNVGRTIATPRELVDRFAAPWRAMIARAGLRALMPSHQTVFGVPVHGNAWLGQALLRATGASTGGVGLGFQGFSTSDCSDLGALVQWGLATDSETAAALGMAATVDMDNMCGTNPDDHAWTYTELQQAVEDGLVPEATVNASASRVLSQKFAAGLFDQPFVNTSGLARVGSPEHLAIAKEAAIKGAVLIQNQNDALPLKLASGDTVALIGPLVDCFTTSDAHNPQCDTQTAYLGKPQHPLGDLDIPTVAEVAGADASARGFTVKVAEGTSVSGRDEDKIQAAVAAAAGADVAVLVLGDSTTTAAEWGDRASLELPGSQGELLARVLMAEPRPGKVVVLLVNGRPVVFTHNGTDLSASIDAVLVGWRGGQFAAEALWELATGVAQPTGRLPQPWLRSVGQVGGPATSWQRNGKWIANTRGPKVGPDGVYPFDPYVFEDASPLYPLGFGLSYGDFNPTYSDIAVTCGAVSTSADVVCTAVVTVTNSGKDAGVETVQVYVATPVPFPTAPDWRRLAAFAKVSLAAGQTAKVNLSVRAAALATTLPAEGVPLGGPQLGSRAVVKGPYDFMAGPNSLTAVVHATADVPGGPLTA